MSIEDYPWIDREEYPFEPKTFETPHGRMSYVDEGSGAPVVMLHGNPTWSFLYRHLIKGLAPKYRLIAPDHLGFGLSDKPPDWSYLPEAHANNLKLLLDDLDLDDITLVVQDWGGPIGLSYAVENSDKISRIVIMNTWAWPVNDEKHFIRFSGFMGGPIGRFLIRRFNFFVNVVMKKAMGNPKNLTPEIHHHYKMPLANPADRKGCMVFPKQIIASGEWLSTIWERRSLLAKKPAIIVWGKKDIAFRKKELTTWQTLFPDAKCVLLDKVGHYVPEEAGDDLVFLIDEFLSA